jgi:hypothetical protein
MRGLDPRIHAGFPFAAVCVDCRVEPGNDEGSMQTTKNHWSGHGAAVQAAASVPTAARTLS